MKKIIVSSFALLFVVITNAQGFHIGLKAGANLGKVDGQSFKQGYNLGYQLGGYLEIPIAKKIDLRPEVLFSENRTKYDTTGQIFPDLKNGQYINLNYLSIPLLLQIRSSKLLTIQLGPQYSILVHKEQTWVSNGVNAFKKGDFSMLAGAQVNLGALNVYGRYVIGLSNINDLTNSDNWKSQQIQFGLGFRIL